MLSSLRLTVRPITLPRVVPRHVLYAPGRRFLSQEARKHIEDAIKASPVVLFMKGNPKLPQCGFSRAVVQILDVQGVPPDKFKTYDVLEDSELRDGIKEFSDWPTIPQLYVNGEFIGGCDIVLGMHQSGELESMLVKNDILPSVTDSAAPTTQS